ncbi:hypothetical protein LXL04_026518 [Taraxacum kok-saghyz]
MVGWLHIFLDGSIQKKNVLLVIAHLDDEFMFFSPTINQVTSRGHNVYMLFLSTGCWVHQMRKCGQELVS